MKINGSALNFWIYVTKVEGEHLYVGEYDRYSKFLNLVGIVEGKLQHIM